MLPNNEPILYEELWVNVSRFTSVQDTVKWSGVNRFFNHAFTPLRPFYQIWKLFFATILKENALIHSSHFTDQAEKLFVTLLKDYMSAVLKNEQWSTKIWLEKHPQILFHVWNILKEPINFNIDDLQKRHDHPEMKWYDERRENEIRYPLKNDELLALYISKFRSEYNLSSKSSNESILLAGSNLLDHLLFSKEFNFFSLQTTMFFVQRMGNPQRERIQKSLVQLNSMDDTKIDKNIIFLQVMERVFNILFNSNIYNEKNTAYLKSIINSKSHKITSPYFPDSIAYTKIDGFHIRWTFGNDSIAESVKSKLEHSGLKPGSGRIKINGKSKAAIDLLNIEVADILIANKNYTINNANQNRQHSFR